MFQTASRFMNLANLNRVLDFIMIYLDLVVWILSRCSSCHIRAWKFEHKKKSNPEYTEFMVCL